MRLSGGSKSVILLLVAVALCDIALAEKLPLRHFTTQDGLAGNVVHCIVRDSRNLLWFCTNDGLSVFDGHSFVTFGSDHGLGDQEVMHVLETSDGAYWVGTARGISQLNSRSPYRSASFANFFPGNDRRSQWIQRLVEDNTGRIWIATNGGLYRMSAKVGQSPVFHHIALPMPAQPSASPRVLALAKDNFGQIWAGSDHGLYSIRADGGIERYSMADGLPTTNILSLALDSRGALWVGVDGGLCRVQSREVGRAIVDRVYQLSDGLPDSYIASIHESSGWLWAGTVNGLVRLPSASLGKLTVFGRANGLRHPSVETLAEDGQGNLWIGTMGGGASRLSASGFTTYGSADGLASVEITGIVEAATGELCAVSTRGGSQLTLNRFDGERFVAIQPRFPPHVTQFGWGWAQIALQNPLREWWIATSDGAVRFPSGPVDKLATAQPSAFLRTSQELPEGIVFRLFTDKAGDLWISTNGYDVKGLTRWERRTGRIKHFRPEDGLPGPAGDDRSLASAFAEDASGNLWIGFHRGGLFRFRAGRLVAVLPHEDAFLEGVRWIHCDAVGRLWIAGRKGLLRIDDLGEEQPVFRHYGIDEGLASSLALSIAEDHLGRVYIGSGRGVDRLDPKTGGVRHFGATDGLVGGEIRVAHRDKQGYLWFGSSEGLSRYDPRHERSLPAPAIYISHVSVGGNRHVVAYPGEAQVAVRPVNWRHNSLHVDFMGVGDSLRYQYQLEGVDGTWSDAREWRGVHYPGLEAGTYRFIVRAVNVEGTSSSQPATVQFQIEAPFWITSWFRLLLATTMLATVFAFHRLRIAKAVAVERIRHRIAKDLHDDVGASLCHAALLSDLIHRENPAPSVTRERVEQISSVCREALDSMSDIVWAINPERDKVGDLAQRMRRFGEELLAPKGLAFHFFDNGTSDTELPPQVRHQVFLIFKEAIHNIVRHSNATNVGVELSAKSHVLILRIADNGRGLPDDMNANGQGLRSMHERVTALRGSMRVDKDSKDSGATLEFKIPLTSVPR